VTKARRFNARKWLAADDKQEVIQFMVDGISNGPSSSRTVPDLVGKGQSRHTVLLVPARVSRISGSENRNPYPRRGDNTTSTTVRFQK
jgi:hypothetical protein